MFALGRWIRSSLLGALFIGFGTAFVQAVRWAIKELFGSAVEEWLSGRLGQITGLEQASVLATGVIVAVPALVFAAAVYGAVLVTKHLTRRALLANGAGHERGGAAPVAGIRPGRLAFIFSDGPDFAEHRRDATGAVRKTVRVAVANTGGAELTECRVRVEGVTPGREPPAPPLERVPLHAEPFTLPARGKRTLDLAFHDEALPDGSPAAHIVINMPKAMFHDFFKVSGAAPQTVLLRAEAAEGVYADAACLLFLENGRLRLVEL